MEDELNSLANDRRPQFSSNGRQSQYSVEWKSTSNGRRPQQKCNQKQLKVKSMVVEVLWVT